jgi:hypothetical protein
MSIFIVEISQIREYDIFCQFLSTSLHSLCRYRLLVVYVHYYVLLKEMFAKLVLYAVLWFTAGLVKRETGSSLSGE